MSALMPASNADTLGDLLTPENCALALQYTEAIFGAFAGAARS